ncbi:hypothetical protein E2562_032355 [Oryza meyeriana var. granulata]|uniref:Uncharacterized protein n=1 Tax=Oryza meyeriana var. granulata TaxID=110450 RepID=A0A6G1E7L7_9ORYZ|nr:hypothetical protein E2562_032355 [Oryza meyeriana var. granulata]
MLQRRSPEVLLNGSIKHGTATSSTWMPGALHETEGKKREARGSDVVYLDHDFTRGRPCWMSVTVCLVLVYHA